MDGIGNLLGGVVNQVFGNDASSQSEATQGASSNDSINQLIGQAGDALGLSKEVTGALKVGAGLFTGDQVSLADRGESFIKSLAQDLSQQTQQSFNRSSGSVAGYAESCILQAVTQLVSQLGGTHQAIPVQSAPQAGSDIDIEIHIHTGGTQPPPGTVGQVPALPTRQDPTSGTSSAGGTTSTSGTSSTDGASAASGTSATDAATQALQQKFETLKTLEENFDPIDMRYLGPLFGKDGHIDMDDLQHLSESSLCPPDVKRAVRQLMEDPKLYQALAQSGGAITRADLQMVMDDIQKEIASISSAGTNGTSSTGGSTSTSGADGTSGTSGTDSTDGTSGTSQASGADGASSTSDASGDLGGQIKNILADPSLSIEEKIQQVLMLIEQQLDKELGDTMQQMADAQRQPKSASSSDKASAEKADNNQELLQQKLQTLVERRKAMFDLMSNIDSKFNEMASLAIQNLGKA